MKEKFNISFKRYAALTGRAAVGYSHQSVVVKVNKKEVGTINAPNWNTKDNYWRIRIAFEKVDINSDGNPNSTWNLWKIGGLYENEDAARQYLKENLKQVIEDIGLNLHFFDD